MLTLSTYNCATLSHVTGDIYAVSHGDGTNTVVELSNNQVRVISGKALGKDLESWIRFTIRDVSTPLHQLGGRPIPKYHDDTVDSFNVQPNVNVHRLAESYHRNFGMH